MMNQIQLLYFTVEEEQSITEERLSFLYELVYFVTQEMSIQIVRS